MDNLDEKNNGEEPEIKKPKLWGTLYIVLGICGITYSIYILINCSDTVPLIGALTAGVLIGALSVFMIVLGYRVIKKDY